jgi:DNA-binding NtrC family response regulator
LPETLLASELFGHVRGAFTHAVSDKEGKLAAADGGTLFLDEIDAASPQLQVKLLRALQNRTFEPVGSNATRTVDVRIILATNRDLKAEVAAGRFRQDLYYRINVVNIELPPLRQRLSDIPLLAEHFLARFAAESGRQVEGFTAQALQAMQRYDWPGNVRELENCVERAVVLCRSGRIDVDDLPPAVLGRSEQPGSVAPLYQPGQTLSQALLGPEKQIISAALEAHDGSRQATADALGINRTTLYKKMRKFDLLD